MSLAIVNESESPESAEVAFLRNSTLTAAQVLAVRALAEGASLNDAARAAGVERNTLYRWRTRNAQFIAAMNAWAPRGTGTRQGPVPALRDAALAAVRQGLADGDGPAGNGGAWIAWACLRLRKTSRSCPA